MPSCAHPVPVLLGWFCPESSSEEEEEEEEGALSQQREHLEHLVSARPAEQMQEAQFQVVGVSHTS